MSRGTVAWAITGMVRNQGLLLSNIEIILGAASPHLLDLTFVANDDDALANDAFLGTVEGFGARVVRLPPGRNGSWDVLTRQAGQLEYAWNEGGLSESGADVLVRSRPDLWLRHAYVTWICEGFAAQNSLPPRVLVRGVHPTLPGYAEDLILAAPTSSLDLLFDVRADLVPVFWRAHKGLMVHLARFAAAYTRYNVLGVYEDALSAVFSDIRSRPRGKLHWKAVTTTLPGGFWQLHQAALGQLSRNGQLLDYLRCLQLVGESTFVLPPAMQAPGHGLDRGDYGRVWLPTDVEALVTATSKDFVACQEEVNLWGQSIIDGAEGLEHGVNVASEFGPPSQRLGEAAFLATERSARRTSHGIRHKGGVMLRAARKRLPAS